MPVDTAIPLGMVVNELVTNAVKYAYPYPTAGVISVQLTRVDQGIRLIVADDGDGLSEEALRASNGLGMRLVRSLVAQVDGELVVRGPPGTVFEISLAAVQPH